MTDASSEIDERTGYNTEQRARASAVQDAAHVLTGGEKGGPFLTPGSKQPAAVQDIVDLAEYVVSGDPYAVKEARQQGMVSVIPLSLDDLLRGRFPDEEADAHEHDADRPDFTEGAAPEGAEQRQVEIPEDPFLDPQGKDDDPFA